MSLVLSEQGYLPSTVAAHGDFRTVYGEPQFIGAKPGPNCRTCAHGGMAGCHLQPTACFAGSRYEHLPPVQFWRHK